MLGEKIKLYRESKDMTQVEIAESLGVKPATISKYESGTLEPNIESLKKLAEIFNVSVDELIKEDDFDISKINILETVNHFKLVDYMLDVADKKLTENMIKDFHKILKEGTSDSRKDWFTVGDYKKLTNEVGGLKTTAPKNVEKDMKKLLEWYGDLKQVTINEIIEFHAKFEKIHPFQDGNGRVGRIIAFKECLKNNIVPFIILDKEKLFYYRGLNQYQTNKEKGYLIDTCLNAQAQYTEMIKYYIGNK